MTAYFESSKELFDALDKIDAGNYMDFFAVCEAPPFKSLLIQNLIREVNGKEQSFLSIRDIEILPQYRGKGHFKKIFDIIESKKVPFYFDDVVNPKLDSYLNKKGYKINRTEKYGNAIYSRYKEQSDFVLKNENLSSGSETKNKPYHP